MNCPMCNQRIVEPYGTKGQPLIVTDVPSKVASQQGRLWADQYAEIWMKELSYIGISSHKFYFLSMWLHPPLKACDFSWHLERLEKLFLTSEHVLFLGAKVCKHYLKDSPYSLMCSNHSLPDYPHFKTVMAAPKIESLASPSGAVGDFRLALEKFVMEVRKHGDVI